MKCPLRMITRPGLMQPEAHPNDDCLKEECAWWYKDGARCAHLDICSTLNCIEIALSDIEKKMPHLEQFKRA